MASGFANHSTHHLLLLLLPPLIVIVKPQETTGTVLATKYNYNSIITLVCGIIRSTGMLLLYTTTLTLGIQDTGRNGMTDDRA